MNALPIIVGALCVMAIAYRYYSAFLAAKVLALDPAAPVPSKEMYDGHNYYPTNKWVLFGHHFAAISGAGPLIGPVLAAQFGFLPGLLWLVIGVCLGGAVHDFMILVASVRRRGKSLAEIARTEISPLSGLVAGVAILFIVVIALAALGDVYGRLHDSARASDGALHVPLPRRTDSRGERDRRRGALLRRHRRRMGGGQRVGLFVHLL
jgi:carbon starvation protein